MAAIQTARHDHSIVTLNLNLIPIPFLFHMLDATALSR